MRRLATAERGPIAFLAVTRADTSAFVGRRNELRELARLVRAHRLVTLVGPGGVGKTRLARELVANRLPSGHIVVDLSATATDDDVAPTVARAAGAEHTDQAAGSADPLAGLGHGKLTLILDSCETVAGGVALLAAAALAERPAIQIVATSRSPLGVAGEVVWQTPPLSLPDGHDLPHLGRSDAVRLFFARARLADPRLTFDERTGRAIAAICRAVDGLPLAIELAAARVRHLGIETLQERIADPLRILVGGPRAAPERQATIRGTIEWSYSLLDERERVALRNVAVFPAAFFLDGAEAVCAAAGIPPDLCLGVLSRLVDGSLIQLVTDPGPARYRMLTVVREYALERAAEAGERETAELAVARHVAALAARFDIDSDPRPADWFRRVALDHPNLRLGMDALLRNDPASAREAIVRLAPLYTFSKDLDGWLDRALADPSRDLVRAQLLIARSRRGGDQQVALAAAQEAQAITSELGDRRWWGAAAFGGAVALAGTGDHERTAALLADAIGALVAAGSAEAAWVLGYRAASRARSGDHAGAERDLAEALATCERSPHHRRLLGIVRLFEADVALRAGDVDRAKRAADVALEIRRSLGMGLPPVRLLAIRAEIAWRDGQLEAALRLAGAAEAMSDRTGRHDREGGRSGWLREIEPTLSPRLAGHRVAGRSMSEDEAVAVALALGAARPRDTLTKREREVAALVADGLTSREVADRLVITERTAENHVDHIRNKLGLRSRVEIGRWVLEHPAGSG